MKASLKSIIFCAAMALPASSALAQGEFFAVSPCRFVDTGSGTSGFTGPTAIKFYNIVYEPNEPNNPGMGNCRETVPNGSPAALAIAVNVTVQSACAGGNVRVFPGDATNPPAATASSTLNIGAANKAIANMITVGLRATPASPSDPNDQQDLLVQVNTAGCTAKTRVILDVLGYFQDSASGATPSTAAKLPVSEKVSAGDLVVRGRDERNDGYRLASVADGKGVIGVVTARAGKDYDLATGLPTARVALGGTVRVKVDVSNGRIQAGDLLTISSRRPGHAAAAQDGRADIVIGTALESHDRGTGRIRVMLSSN